jgi:hypothetical protein
MAESNNLCLAVLNFLEVARVASFAIVGLDKGVRLFCLARL